jgi:hypothetical protein
LIDIILINDDQRECQVASASLQKILQGELLSVSVPSLKVFLNDQTYHEDEERYRICYEVIWHCAQNMPYPSFYQAWKEE